MAVLRGGKPHTQIFARPVFCGLWHFSFCLQMRPGHSVKKRSVNRFKLLQRRESTRIRRESRRCKIY